MVRGRKRELQPQTVAAGLQLPLWRGVASLLAHFPDPSDAPSPCLNHSGAEECVGDSRVVRLGRKFSSELIGGPFRWQLHRIPDHDPVIMHTNPNRRGAGVIPVNDGVDHRFAHGFARHGKGLHAVNAIVGNQCPRVLGVQQVHRPIDLSEQVAFDNILIQQLRTAEIADLHVGFHHEPIRCWMKEQDRGALEETRLPQLEPFDHPFIGFVQDVLWQAFAIGTPLAKPIKRTTVQVFEADARQGHVVPRSAVSPRSFLPISKTPPCALAKPQIHFRYSSRHVSFHSMFWLSLMSLYSFLKPLFLVPNFSNYPARHCSKALCNPSTKG